MKLLRIAGDTNQILNIFIQDNSSALGSGLGSLVYNTAGLKAYYWRDTSSSITQIQIASGTMGTYVASGLIEANFANALGFYQFCPPNAVFAAGAKSAILYLQGAANMAPLPIEIDLAGMVLLSSGTQTGQVLLGSGILQSNSVQQGGVTQTGRDIGLSVLLSSGNGVGQVLLSAGIVQANTVQLGGITQTGRDIGASVLLASGNGTGQVLLSAGILQANTVQLGGVNQTGRDIGFSVLLSSGNQLGQVLLSSGILQANTVQISGIRQAGRDLGTSVLLASGNGPGQVLLSNGIIQANTVQLAGVNQTGRDIGASVLLSSGNGAGQVLLSAGIVQANSVQQGGTNQTGRDIGASVLLSSGTFLGQVLLTSGILQTNAVQLNGASLQSSNGYIGINWGQILNPTANVSFSNTSVSGLIDRTSFSLSQAFPTNFSAFNINTSGQIQLQSGINNGQVLLSNGIIQSNTVQLNGTAQTGRDIGSSVLLSSGVGTGQVLLSDGIVQANTVQYNNKIAQTDASNLPKIDVENIKGVASIGQVGTVGIDWSQLVNVGSGPYNMVNTYVQVYDKTDFSLTQAFPTNFSSLSIDTNGRAAILSGVTKNIAISNFEFKMFSSTDHITPASGLTILGLRSLDGAAFGPCTNYPIEVANGIYKINLSAADLNANVVGLQFAASGGTFADVNNITLMTTP